MESDSCVSERSETITKPVGSFHKCPFEGCLAAFNRPNKLTHHIRKHNNERPFVCNVEGCSKSYTNNSHLRRHLKSSHTKQTQVKLKCPHCTAELSSKQSLKKHIMRNHDPNSVKSFQCKECDKVYKRKHLLKIHMKKHANETVKKPNKMHKCLCGDGFEKWSKLLEHREVCKAYLERFKCHLCGDFFTRQVTFEEHIMNHFNFDNRKCYVCEYEDCGRIYFHKRNLDFHIKKYHLKIVSKSIPCEFEGCTKLFFEKNKMISHMEKVHHSKKVVTNKLKRHRKDINSFKRSTVAKLLGLDVPYEVERNLINIHEPDVEIKDSIDMASIQGNSEQADINSLIERSIIPETLSA